MKTLSLEKGTVNNYILARSREKKAGIELLKAEFEKETQDDFLICALCDFVATCEQTCVLLKEASAASAEEGPVIMSVTNVTALKLLYTATTKIKQMVAEKYNLSLQIH
jgi:hypothetical protein